MIHLNRYIFILYFISGILPFSQLNVNGMAAAGGQDNYVVKFGDSYHNYKKENLIRIAVSFKSLRDKPVDVKQEIVVLNSNNEKVWNSRINLELKNSQEFTVPFMVPVPQLPGSYTLTIPNTTENLPFFKFTVIEPHKSSRLSKILVVTPDWEEGLESFVDSWAIKAPSIAFGQVVLCGKKTLQRLNDKDEEAQQLIDRALRRDMSVIFLDFGPVELKEGTEFKIKMPYDLRVNFIKASSPEINFIPERSIKALNYDLPSENSYSLNGLYGISIPEVDMRFEGKDVLISGYVNAGKKPFRTPVVEVKPNGGKGKLILCQVITEGRLNEKVIPPRNKPELPAYDPLAVQFVLNLISASVGDELFK
jgi:hypothetical protein